MKMLILKLNLKDKKVLLQKHGEDDYELYESDCFCGVNEGSSFRGSADDILEYVEDLDLIGDIIGSVLKLDSYYNPSEQTLTDILKGIGGIK
jgi:hypothetical protein